MQSVLAPLIGPKVCVPPSLVGRTAIVTGGALGIGYEISRAFAKSGARVIMVNRKEEQGDEAIAKIKAEKADALVEWRHCDLGNLAETRDVFGKIAKEEERLDLFIASAGINVNTYGLDSDGLERIFAVNYLGHHLAIKQCYPLMRKTSKLPGAPAPRIVFESSELHRFAPSDAKFASLDEIMNDQLGPLELYGRSKMAMICGTKGLYEKVIKPNGDNVYVLAVHPGAVNTDMQDQWAEAYGTPGKMFEMLTLAIGRDPEQGSYSGIYAACDPEVEEKQMNAFYLSDPATPGKETALAASPELRDNLWALSEKLIKDKVGTEGIADWNDKA